MFSKDSKPKSDMPGPDLGGMTPSASQAIAATPSIISADLKIIGNMHSNGDIQIDGQIDGDVDSKSLTIGESAKVNGTVSCERVRVCGSVSGEIRATSVVLARSARVDGDIVHKTLEIEAGASLQGGVRRLEDSPAAAAPKKDAKPANVSKITEAKPAAPAGHTGNGNATAV
jgi:cytoskeletal protein CcmA (bactofilin family)